MLWLWLRQSWIPLDGNITVVSDFSCTKEIFLQKMPHKREADILSFIRYWQFTECGLASVWQFWNNAWISNIRVFLASLSFFPTGSSNILVTLLWANILNFTYFIKLKTYIYIDFASWLSSWFQFNQRQAYKDKYFIIMVLRNHIGKADIRLNIFLNSHISFISGTQKYKLISIQTVKWQNFPF